jgi:allantoinase
MCVAVHPYVSGVPYRIKYFNQVFDYMKKHEGVVFMTGAGVLDWYLEATAG